MAASADIASAAKAPSVDQVPVTLGDLWYDVHRVIKQTQMRQKTSGDVFSEIRRLVDKEGNIYWAKVLEIIAYDKLENETKAAASDAASHISRSCIWAGMKAVAEAATTTVITASTTNAAATTAAERKKPLDELHADILVYNTSRDFLSEVHRLLEKLGYEKFLCINAQEPWGVSEGSA